jgi:predicted transposase YbfD/YdcC
MNFQETPPFLEHFADLPDPRTRRSAYPLQELLLVAVCAILSGADNWVDVADWGRAKLEWLRRVLPFESGAASHDTFGRVFALLDAAAFEARFIAWMGALCPALSGVVPIDGKTVRRSHGAGRKAIHVVSAFARSLGVALGQVKTAEKSNEITAIPELLDALLLRGCLVTIDAMGCQKAIALKILEREADYALMVKNNQPALAAAVEGFFEAAERSGFEGVAHTRAEWVDGGHGRIETRRCVAAGAPDGLEALAGWPKLKTLVLVESIREVNGAASTERRYYISSRQADAEHLGCAVRGHWGIENGLHWSLDVAYGEDQSRMREGNAAENFSILRRITLNLIRLDKTRKTGIKNCRLKAGWNNAYMEKLLGMQALA